MQAEPTQHRPVRVRIAGSGDAFGSGGQFQTCLVVDDSQGCFTIDFGATSLVALQQLGIDPAAIDLVLLSHLHGDHFGGLPFLLLHRQFAATTARRLTLAGPPGFAARVRALMDCMYPDLWREQWRFELDFVELAPGGTLSVLGRQVTARKVRHAAGPQDALGLRIETDGRIIAFSGDTGWVDELLDLARGSDLFICECNDRHDEGYGTHLDFDRLSQNRDRLDTRRLLLSHLGPTMVAAIAELPVEAAVFGQTLDL